MNDFAAASRFFCFSSSGSGFFLLASAFALDAGLPFTGALLAWFPFVGLPFVSGLLSSYFNS